MKSLIDSLLRVFVAALLVSSSVNAIATDSEGNYATYGFGTISCGELMKSYDKDDLFYSHAQSWVSGYATATGRWHNAKKHLLSVAEIEGMMLVIRQYCLNNPLNDLSHAAEFMAVEVLEKANE